MKKRVLYIFSLLLIVGNLNAAHLEEYLIDTPTAKVAPVKTFASTNRIISQGGLISFFTFTPLERLSIGTGITLEHIVGTNEQSIKLLVPSLQLKYQFFDGTEFWPMFALGFDNQGFYYDHKEKEYLQKAKGLYLAATKEILTQGLFLNCGINITTNGFEFSKLHGYTALNYKIAQPLDLMIEWDNLRDIKESRLNSGLRVYIVEFFALDFAVRNFNNKAERILQIKYNYTF